MFHDNLYCSCCTNLATSITSGWFVCGGTSQEVPNDQISVAIYWVSSLHDDATTAAKEEANVEQRQEVTLLPRAAGLDINN